MLPVANFFCFTPDLKQPNCHDPNCSFIFNTKKNALWKQESLGLSMAILAAKAKIAIVLQQMLANGWAGPVVLSRTGVCAISD